MTLDKLGRKFVRDEKQLNHIAKLKNVIDVNLQYYMEKMNHWNGTNYQQIHMIIL